MFRKGVKCRSCGFLAVDVLTETLALTRKSPQKREILRDVGMLGLAELTISGRENLSEAISKGQPYLLNCAKHIWFKSELNKKDSNYVDKFLNSNRKCAYFFPYRPGYSPLEHRELQREAKTHNLLTRNMLLAAAIGAGAAILAQHLAG